MTKNQYLLRLDQCLADLPEDKRIEALTACENRFRQNGLNREAETIRQLGAPEAVAGSIRRRWQEEQDLRPEPAEYQTFPDFQPDIDFKGFSQPSADFVPHSTEGKTPEPEMPQMPELDTRILHEDFLYGEPEKEDSRSEPVTGQPEQTAFVPEDEAQGEKTIPRQPHGYRYDRSRGGWLAPEEWEEADYPEEYGEDEDEEDDGEEAEKKPLDPQTRAKRKKQLKLAGVAAVALLILLILIPIVRNIGKGVSFLLSGLVLCFCAGLLLAVKGLGTFVNGMTMLADSPLNGALCSALGLAICGAGCILFGLTLAILMKGVPVLVKSCRTLIGKLRGLAANRKGGQAS